jgi:hypothetical protein
MEVLVLFIDALQQRQLFVESVMVDDAAKATLRQAVLARAQADGLALLALNALAPDSQGQAQFVATVLPRGVSRAAVAQAARAGKPVARGGAPIRGPQATSATVAARRRADRGGRGA